MKFENVVRNIRDIAALKHNGKNCDSLHIFFVVMDQNAHELPELIRLAKDVGIPNVFAQAVEVRSLPFLGEGDNVDFKMPTGELRRYMDEAQAEADRLNIRFEPTSGLVERAMGNGENANAVKAAGTSPSQTKMSFSDRIKFCHVPWVNSNRFSLNESGVVPSTVCCHMPVVAEGYLMQYKQLYGCSISSIFNSDIYWDIREKLLDGSLAQGACRGCQYYESTQWTADQLRALEAAVSAAQARGSKTE